MKQYLDTLRLIMRTGSDKMDRTGIGTRSIFANVMRFNLSDGFPAMTTKKLAWNAVKSEILWFLEGSTDERRLAEILYGKPREELIGKSTIWTANADAQGKALGYVNTDIVKELGPVYGSRWRAWEKDDGSVVDQIQNIIDTIKTNPADRRMILSGWDVGKIDKMALPPCHTIYNFNVIDGKVNCLLMSRSGDTFLGTPFNVAGGSLLTSMIAHVCGLEAGEFAHITTDAHIYHNHFDAVEEQLTREPLPLPKLWLNPLVKNINDFTMDDIKLIDYQCHGQIKAPMAV